LCDSGDTAAAEQHDDDASTAAPVELREFWAGTATTARISPLVDTATASTIGGASSQHSGQHECSTGCPPSCRHR
jgi:hypothetical protein